MKREYRSFDEARKIAHSLKLKNRDEWTKYCKSGNKPDDIPTMPNQVYKNQGWISVGDFLGTGTIAPKDRKYILFEDAKKFVHSLELKSSSDWKKYCTLGNKPVSIPTHPHKIYKNQGWKSWGDWFGTGTIQTQKLSKNFLSFDKAKQFVQSKNLKSGRKWREYTKDSKFPKNIPKAPEQFYKEWKSMGDWLGTGIVAPQLMDYWKFNESKQFVHSLKLKNRNEWREYCKSGSKHKKLPANPNVVYKNKGWKGLGDWLGTGTIQAQQRVYLSYEDAKKFVQKLELKNNNEWLKYCKSDNKPDNIPSAPNNSYKKEWTNWGDWLGTGTVANQILSKNYLSIDKAKIEARLLARKYNLRTQEDWLKAHREGKIPKYLPRNPWQVYPKRKKK